jgi:hypothetical protein
MLMNIKPKYRRPSAAQAAVGLALAMAAMSGLARAGCSDPHWATSPPASTGSAAGAYDSAGFGPGAFIRVGDFTQHPAIVGLWKFEMLAKSTAQHTNPMPDGTLIDFGTAAWHDDGTELMNSGSRDPADGNFCQGVWRQVGPSTFTLNHIALAWTSGAYTGPAVITERVTVDGSGRHIGGSFTLTQYLATPTPGHEFDQSTVLVSITGTISGNRVTAN